LIKENSGASTPGAPLSLAQFFGVKA